MNTTTKYTEAAQRKWAARGNKPLSREAKTAQIKKLKSLDVSHHYMSPDVAQELSSLGVDDFVRILTEPDAALTTQSTFPPGSTHPLSVA